MPAKWATLLKCSAARIAEFSYYFGLCPDRDLTQRRWTGPLSRMRYPIFALCLMSASAAVADCPPPPNIDDAKDRLLEQIQIAPNETLARVFSNQLWDLWAKAPDQHAQDILDRGLRAHAAWEFDAAIEAFTELIVYCPDYAEGYNQRAFVKFIRQDYAAALDDLDRAIERSPKHVAAISGKALTLMGLGRNDEAQDVLRAALAMNPWLPEKRFLVEEPGQEL